MPALDASPKVIQSIYAWHSEGKLFVNRRYQRKLVWTLHEKQKLIESISSQYPVPAILLAEREGGGFEIIDGVQRLFAIISFIENAYPALDGRHFDVSHFSTAQLRADEDKFEQTSEPNKFSQREVSMFLDYVMAITIMREASEAEIDDVFARINTYGHRLSDQERRQSGVQDDFSALVRELATTLRGDVSSDTLLLEEMPTISIDLPMSKHGYHVQAEDVFWVSHGILRATDLRDSLDEQYIADLAASIVGGAVIERSKSALDAIYDSTSDESARIEAALKVYGSERFSDEFNFCIDEIRTLCLTGSPKKLREILFSSPNTNGFPSVFAVVFFALHEVLVQEQNRIADYAGMKAALEGLSVHISAKATSFEKRRRHINLVKGLITPHVVPGEAPNIYGSQAIADIDGLIQRSKVEAAHYELKQGILTLAPSGRAIDEGMIPKLVRTICGIANNGKWSGSLLIGVTDKDEDAEKVGSLDGISPRRVGYRYVVGVQREAVFLGESAEAYFARIKHGIERSELTASLKADVLSAIDYHDYFGLGIIVISVPPQQGPSFVAGKAYWRKGDQTVEATPEEIVTIVQRFS
ncbi:DUF262 domain-containing protein [Microterricola viridarii]|uniref:GmrSD restriction endonucleases N-terminal domain-containing protein n=1 Tax=Microterricola viridarii TaxID=412690 RepID=A0A109QXN9_9MICO|nr:DUF262 domain-containing protein [Microterricola viridarii]AMB60304.1 hypothetical protein AWU67_03110 [Microterricola viridarii]